MDRRHFIKSTGIAGSGAILGGKTVAGKQQSATGTGKNEIRNILFLFVDQQRADCLGCYGNPVVGTPNIDRLAQRGIRFDNAFTPTPLCSPARAALQTGLWAHNSRIMFNTGRGNISGGVDDPAPGIDFFSDSLKRSGWNLAHIGKWHIGSEKNTPEHHGYEGINYPGYGLPSGIYGPRHEHYIEYLKSLGLSGFNLLSEKRDPAGRKLYSGLQEGPREASIPYYLAEQTIDYIEKFTAGSRPFFISCNFWGPHEPYCIPEPYYTMYRGSDIDVWPNFDCDIADKPIAIRRYGDYWRTGFFSREIVAGLIAEYYGYIKLIDDEIGRILDELEKSGEIDRTLIVYSADHGSTVGSYRMWAKGFGMYDVITRIPMIVSHPSIRPETSDAFVTLLDLAPTFLGVGEGGVRQTLDGVSMIPLIDGSRRGLRDDYIVTEAFGHVVPFWQRMVRTPETKYIYSPTADDEFYDLAEDPHETRNIIGSIDRTTLARHKEMLIAEMKRSGDDLLFWAQSTILD